MKTGNAVVKAATIVVWLLIGGLNSCAYSKDIHISAVPGGIYELPEVLNDQRVVITGSGSEQSPFVLTGSRLGTTMIGKSSIHIKGDFILVEGITFYNNEIPVASEALIKVGALENFATSITIKDCKFTYIGVFRDLDKQSQFFWIRLTANNSRVVHCEFSGKQNRLPIIHVDSKGTGNAILYSTFRDVAPRHLEALEAIRVGLGDGDSDLLISYNKFINYHGDSETISIKANGVKVIDNTFISSRSGVCLRLGNNALIKGNKFYNTVWPIRISGKGHIIVGNLFDAFGRCDIVFMEASFNYAQVEDIMIKDNLFVGRLDFVLLKTKDSKEPPRDVYLKSNYTKEGVSKRIKDRKLNASFFEGDVHKENYRQDGINEVYYYIEGQRAVALPHRFRNISLSLPR